MPSLPWGLARHCTLAERFTACGGRLLILNPVGCVYSIRSRRALVLVQQSAETVATFQRDRLHARPRRRRRPTIRRLQVQAAMRPPTVVMINEHGEGALQMPGRSGSTANPGTLIELSGRTARQSHS